MTINNYILPNDSSISIPNWVIPTHRMEGNLLLIFVDVKKHGDNYAAQCVQTLSMKLKRGEKLFLFDAYLTSLSSSHDAIVGYP